MLEEKAQDLMINVRGLLPLIVSKRAECAWGDPHSADRAVACGQGRPGRGQNAQPGTAF